MTEVLICPECNSIYKKSRIKEEYGCYLCPNKKELCTETRLIPIDENLANTILQFLNMGIMTLFCCEGHPNSGSDPYIVFGEDIEYPLSLPLVELRDLCIEINKELNNFWEISEIKKGRRLLPFAMYETKCTYFVLRTIPHKEYVNLDIIEKLELKTKFIKSLDLLIEKIGEKLE